MAPGCVRRCHNSWRHAHNADAALIDDEPARFYLEVFLEYWKTKTSDERWRSLEFVARWQGYYELVRGMIPDAQHAGVGLWPAPIQVQTSTQCPASACMTS